MLKTTLVMTAITGTLVCASGFALAADQVRDQTRDKVQDQTRDQTQDRIYGSQMMTNDERNAYRAQMRSAKTAEEREQVRAAHHEQMKARVKERGMTMPDEPPARGSGMGPGGGMGPGNGMGPGGGMGMGRGNR
jgi:hypothetical protein